MAIARRKLIVVSNRGPVSFSRDGEGNRIARRGGGGLVTALRSLVDLHNVTWIASAMTEEDESVAEEAGGEPIAETSRDGAPYRLRLVSHDPQAYDWYYNVVSNPVLWFTQHYLWGLAEAPNVDHGLHHAWLEGYVAVNRAFADVVVTELERQPDAAVFFHHYHLYSAPAMVREQLPNATLAHFVHVPWPQPDYWRVLPDGIRRTLHERLLATRPEFLILRVDRTDPSKNVVRGFRAFELYLEAHPEMYGRVGMLALLDPSRQDIPEYSEYTGAIQRAARIVNDRFQHEGWLPLDLRIADDFPQAVAAYRQFDVLLVNAIFDGMNLVAKEAPLVNTRDGVLILSENTGAHEELGKWAITVNPFDVAGQAEALHQALTLAPEERRARGDAIKAHVREH